MQRAQRAQRLAHDLTDTRADERIGDADPTGKQDQDAPGDLDGRLPVQQAPALAAGPDALPVTRLAAGNQKHDQDRQKRHAGVVGLGQVEPGAPAAEGIGARHPGQRRKRENCQSTLLLSPPGTHVGNDDVSRPGNAASDPQCDQRHENDDHRQTPGHPVDKAKLDGGGVGVNLHEDQVGGRTDGRADAADVAGIRDPQQQPDLEPPRLNIFQCRQGDGQEHETGGGVGYPHAQERRGRHESEHHASVPRTAEGIDHAQRQAPVGAALLHGGGQHESAQVEQDQRASVGLPHLRGREHAHQRKDREGHQRRNRDGERFSDPPGSAQQCDARCPADFGRLAGGGEAEAQCERRAESGECGRPLHAWTGSGSKSLLNQASRREAIRLKALSSRAQKSEGPQSEAPLRPPMGTGPAINTCSAPVCTGLPPARRGNPPAVPTAPPGPRRACRYAGGRPSRPVPWAACRPPADTCPDC